MLYTKRDLLKLLADNNINATTNNLPELVVIALDKNVITRDDVFRSKVEKEKRPRGRPRKYPPKEVDPNKIIDPKYNRLLTIRKNPRKVTLTNVKTGDVTSYHSLYKAVKSTGLSFTYFKRNNGKIVDGMKIEM